MWKTLILTCLIGYEITGLLGESVVEKRADKVANESATERSYTPNVGITKTQVNTASSTKDLKCECGVFETDELDKDSVPLLVQRPITVTCDEHGNKTCHEMCTSLGKLSKEKGPSILCAVVGHATDLKPSVFSRTCQTGPWQYTGLTAKNLICCHDGKELPCKAEARELEK